MFQGKQRLHFSTLVHEGQPYYQNFSFYHPKFLVPTVFRGEHDSIPLDLQILYHVFILRAPGCVNRGRAASAKKCGVQRWDLR